MEEIPSMYWMILIGVVAGFICFVLYQLGMFIKDSRNVIKNAEETVKVVNGIVTDVNEILGVVKGTIYQVNSAILGPINKISSVFNVVSGISEGFSSKKNY